MAEIDQQHRNNAEDPQDKNPHGASADSMESSGEKNTEQKGNSAKMESAPMDSTSMDSTDSSSEADNSQDKDTDKQDKDTEDQEEKFQRLAAAAGLDEEAIARLRAIGLDDEQLEAVLAVAEEHLLPLACALAEAHDCENERAKLVRALGGEQAWQALAPELLRWGKKSLPSEVFAVLAASAEGIQAMQRMRQAQSEPSLISAEGAASGDQATEENDLRRLMADPAYWSKRDPALLARVREGFRRLYPS